MLLHSDLNAARLPIPPRPQVWKREKHLAKRCRHLKRKICKIGRLLTHAYLPSAAGLCANVLRPARAAAIKATVATPITIQPRLSLPPKTASLVRRSGEKLANPAGIRPNKYSHHLVAL
jgi:hypothetical protein